MNKKQFFVWLKDYSLLSIGALLLAINFNIFMAPHQIAPGGIAGLALILSEFTGLSNGLLLLLLQGIMITIGFRHLGRFQFLMRVVFVAAFYSIGVDLFKLWLPVYGITDDLLLNTIYGGIIGGVGAGLIFLGRSSVAGTSVISRSIQIKTGMPISQLYILIDGGIILLLGVVFGWDKALYGMMMLFIYGLAADYVQEGPSVIRTAFIITDQPESVSSSIIERLHIGVTAWKSRGMFTHDKHTVIFCTINRVEVGTLKQIVKETDPDAFIVVGQGHQAVGGVVRTTEKGT